MLDKRNKWMIKNVENALKIYENIILTSTQSLPEVTKVINYETFRTDELKEEDKKIFVYFIY